MSIPSIERDPLSRLRQTTEFRAESFERGFTLRSVTLKRQPQAATATRFPYTPCTQTRNQPECPVYPGFQGLYGAKINSTQRDEIPLTRDDAMAREIHRLMKMGFERYRAKNSGLGVSVYSHDLRDFEAPIPSRPTRDDA